MRLMGASVTKHACNHLPSVLPADWVGQDLQEVNEYKPLPHCYASVIFIGKLTKMSTL